MENPDIWKTIHRDKPLNDRIGMRNPEIRGLKEQQWKMYQAFTAALKGAVLCLYCGPLGSITVMEATSQWNIYKRTSSLILSIFQPLVNFSHMCLLFFE